MNTKHIIAASMLAALAVVLQFIPFFPTQWGMRIDLVAVPWFIALFMFGLPTALLSMSVTTIFLGFTSEASWLGAGIKFVATLIPILMLGSVNVKKKMKKSRLFEKLVDGAIFGFIQILIFIVLRSVYEISFGGSIHALADSSFGLNLYAVVAAYLIGVVIAYLIKKEKTVPIKILYMLVISGLIRGLVMLVVNYYFALPIWLGMSPRELIAQIPFWMIMIPNLIQTIIEIKLAWSILHDTRLKRKIE